LSARPKPAEQTSEEPVLPPGWRDPSGFWLPASCEDARTLVRRRRRGRVARPAPGGWDQDPAEPA